MPAHGTTLCTAVEAALLATYNDSDRPALQTTEQTTDSSAKSTT
jgi:hypothetical protein